MRKYYIALGGKAVGPFEKEELKRAGLTADGLVWWEGLTDWQKAGEAQETRDLFAPAGPPPIPGAAVPPPMPKQVYHQPQQPQQQVYQQPQSPQQQTYQQPQQHVYQQPQQHAYQQPQQQTYQQPGQTMDINRTKYMAIDEDKEVGPFNKIELTRIGLKNDTMVKPLGSTQFVPASQVPELSALLANQPLPGGNNPESFFVSIMAQGGFNSTNGSLLVFDDYITFQPQRALSVMMGNMSKSGYINQYYAMEEIVGLEKGFAARRYVHLTGDRKQLYGAMKRKSFDEIVRRHQAFCQANGYAPVKLEK